MDENMLNNIRQALDINERRARELENIITNPKVTKDEIEYIESIMALFEDGSSIIPRPRILDRQRQLKGITEERAKEIETSLANLCIEEQEYLNRCIELRKKDGSSNQEVERKEKDSYIRGFISDVSGISQDNLKEIEEKGKSILKGLANTFLD
jgi:hypothetical protein